MSGKISAVFVNYPNGAQVAYGLELADGGAPDTQIVEEILRVPWSPMAGEDVPEGIYVHLAEDLWFRFPFDWCRLFYHGKDIAEVMDKWRVKEE